jgi:glycine cleavage system aminomethyltransferase T
LVPVDSTGTLLAGAHLVATGAAATAEHAAGHVTSVAYSPTLGHDIALAFLVRGRDRFGETIRAVDLLRVSDVACRVVDPVFIDPKGEKLRG